MNIDSIQAANAPQRTAAPDATAQASRQARIGNTASPQNNVQVAPSSNTGAGGDQGQLSLQEAVQHLEDFVSIARADISFSIDEASGVQVVKITDRQSKEVIRQFPSEEAIRIAQALGKLQGVFVKDKV